MDELYTLYFKYMTDRLVLAVAGNAVKGSEVSKFRIKPILLKGQTVFQITRTVGQKELHENLTAEAAAKLLAGQTGSPFKQVELKDDKMSALVLVSSKGKVTVKEKKLKQTTAVEQKESTSHNRTKNHVLPEGEPVPFLVELGVMTPKGVVVKPRYDKFRQINRYLEFVEDIIPSLPKGREISIIDFGCGKSYLTFALYYYLHEKKGFDVRITGLDLKADVIEHCNGLARKFGYEKLEFLHGDIADYTGTDSVDMVVTLHACDTATDYALYKAIKWGARVIFCVPCCQHELNRTMKNGELEPLLKYGLIRERTAALFTDALRADMLEERGYKTQILEFIDMEHTPKNILIRAVKQYKQMLPKAATDKEGQKETEGGRSSQYREVLKTLGCEPTLYRLLEEDKEL